MMKYAVPLTRPFPPRSKADFDGQFGWKHGYFLDKEIRNLAANPKHSLLIISREAPTWLLSAWKMQAMAPTPPPTLFVRSSSWRGLNRSPPTQPPRMSFINYLDNLPVEESGVPGDLFMQMYYEPEIRSQYRISAANVLAARTQVYRNWMQLRNLPEEVSSRVVFTRYEDLLKNPYERFRAITDQLNLPCKDLANQNAFDAVSTRVKMGQFDPSSRPQTKHHRSEFCQTVTSDEIYQNILSKMDRAFEKIVLNYDYPDTLIEYCQEVYAPSDANDAPVA